MHAVLRAMLDRGQPIAAGEHLVLHTFGEPDITPDYLSWLNDPAVVRFSNQRFRRHDRSSSLDYLSSFAGSDNLFVAIRLARGDRMVGTMTAYVDRHHGTADMGLLLGERSLWGKGYGLEAWSLLMSYLFETRGLRKITGGALRCNVAMVKIMERSGMHLEGTRVAQELVEGEPQDVLYFAKFR